ncbi:MAG: cyclase family protein, partial [Longimicrobiales bacterium]|nr:cyclase family protein [Longimicrobiales bacterium]
PHFAPLSLAVAALLLVAGCAPAEPDWGRVFDGSAGRWVDLSHAFGPSTIYWPTDTAGFQLEELAYGRTEEGWFYASYAFATAEHGGTHLDAPIHFAEGRRTADRIPLSDLMGPAVVVDVTAEAHADYLVTVADLEAWETAHGQIPEGAVVLLRTGWGARWGDRAAYLGTDAVGPEAVAELHFPGLSPEAAAWLVENRSIVAMGIDTPSVDYGQSADFRAHAVLYEADIAGFENVARLEELPEHGAYVVALPMKIEGGSGGPLRIAAFVPEGAGR